MNRNYCLFLLLLVGCGKEAAPTAVDPPSTPSLPAPPEPSPSNDVDKLAAILKPIGWSVRERYEWEKRV